MPPKPIHLRETSPEDRAILEAMTSDDAADERSRQRSTLILAMLNGHDVLSAALKAKLSRATARKWIKKYNDGGWTALLTIQAPRGGDFLARFDQGFWAETLVRNALDESKCCRAVPYGTSFNQAFTDLLAFQKHKVTEFLLQAFSLDGRWKRPDLLLLPRDGLRKERGNDLWTPDLIHWDNNQCELYVRGATAAIEVETSLWQVKVATTTLSFTVKEEDLQALRNWVSGNGVPLFICQVFYDSAYVLAFQVLEDGIANRSIVPKEDPTTKKVTYFAPLNLGVLLGDIAEPDVEGKVFKAPNGKVTVYGHLTGSRIAVTNSSMLEQLVSGSVDVLPESM